MLDAIHNEMADRLSPKELVSPIGERKNKERSAVIDPRGRLWELRATSNTFGDHAAFFGRLREADLMPLMLTGYVRISTFNGEIGADADCPLTAAQAVTVRALKLSAAREGINYVGVEASPDAAHAMKKEPPRRGGGAVGGALTWPASGSR